jgi:hypothetical protein
VECFFLPSNIPVRCLFYHKSFPPLSNKHHRIISIESRNAYACLIPPKDCIYSFNKYSLSGLYALGQYLFGNLAQCLSFIAFKKVFLLYNDTHTYTVKYICTGTQLHAYRLMALYSVTRFSVKV